MMMLTECTRFIRLSVRARTKNNQKTSILSVFWNFTPPLVELYGTYPYVNP